MSKTIAIAEAVAGLADGATPTIGMLAPATGIAHAGDARRVSPATGERIMIAPPPPTMGRGERSPA